MTTHQSPSETFILEATELLAEIEATTRSRAFRKCTSETLNHLMNAFQTIRSSSAALGLEQLATFTQHIENLLDQVRHGHVPMSDQLVTIMLSATTQIKSLLLALQGRSAVNVDLQMLILESVLQITQPSETMALSEPVWQICFRPNSDFLANGGSPLLLFRELKKLGSCAIKGHIHSIPELEQLNSSVCYLWWSIDLFSYCSESEIRAVFVVCQDPSELEINCPNPGLETRPATNFDTLLNRISQLVVVQSQVAEAGALLGSAQLNSLIQECAHLAFALRQDVIAMRPS